MLKKKDKRCSFDHSIFSDEMRKLLDTRVDERVLSAVEATLSLLVPAAKQLLTEYTV